MRTDTEPIHDSRGQMLRAALRAPLHPLFIGLGVVALLWWRNASRVEPGDAVVPAAVVAVATAVVLVVVRLVARSWSKAALIATWLIVVFFSFGPLVGWRGNDRLWFGVWTAAALIGAIAVLRLSVGRKVTIALNLVALVVVGIACAGVVAGESRYRSEATSSRSGERDIYYLIFDRYGSEDTLRALFDYDNRPFLDALRDRGFYVPKRTNANYPRTAFSLSSSLDMNHLHERFPRESTDRKALSASLTGSRVSRFLRSKGYSYVFVASRYFPLREDLTAELMYRFKVGEDVSRWTGLPQALRETSLLEVLEDGDDYAEADVKRREAYEHPFFAFERLHRIARIPEKTFTFSHLAFPHDPYIAYPNGRYKSLRVSEGEGREPGFRDHLELVNAQILDLVDTLQDVPESSRPIIVIQADEGPWPDQYKLHWPPIRTERTRDVLTEKFGILNAYYMPGTNNEGLYEEITPVNSFRVILNNYFDTDLPMLPDESYVYPTLEQPFAFIRVTDEIGTFDDR